MSVEVLIEPLANNGFRATSGGPVAVSVEAPTREKALAKLKAQIRKRLKNGAELVLVDFASHSEGNPWIEFAGMFQGDPWIEDWKQSVAAYRKKKDAEPELP